MSILSSKSHQWLPSIWRGHPPESLPHQISLACISRLCRREESSGVAPRRAAADYESAIIEIEPLAFWLTKQAGRRRHRRYPWRKTLESLMRRRQNKPRHLGLAACRHPPPAPITSFEADQGAARQNPLSVAAPRAALQASSALGRMNHRNSACRRRGVSVARRPGGGGSINRPPGLRRYLLS